MEKAETKVNLSPTLSDNRRDMFDLVFRTEALRYNDSGLRKYLQVDFDDAIADYSRALELDPSLAVAYFNRGTVLYRLGSYETALRDLTRAAELEPGNREFAEGLEDCQKWCQRTKKM